jgi:hypothetical protein
MAMQPTPTNQFSIRNISEIDFIDLVIDSKLYGFKLPASLYDMLNWAMYEDRRGGQYADLFGNDEFMEALAWHDPFDNDTV